MANKRVLLSIASVVAAVAIAAPAMAIPTSDKGLLEVGDCFVDNGNFRDMGNNLFGAIFEINVDVTIGSGYALTIDSFGSDALGTDTELALYDEDGTMIMAINDDAGDGSLDAYMGFGDANQFASPFNGSTRQGNITNVTELLAGRYLAVIGPFSTTWDSFDVDDTDVSNFQGTGEWLCTICLTRIPTPGSVALLGLGGLAINGRRRRC